MALADVVDLLACPVCGQALAQADQTLRCPDGHAFDVARQGYVTLARQWIRHPGDTVEMVEARQRVHRSGAFEPLVHWVSSALGEGVLPVARGSGPSVATATVGAPPEAGWPEGWEPPFDVLVDVGGGIGMYTESALRSGLVRRAVVLDSSKPALRRAARGTLALAAVGCDLVEDYPLRDGAADLVLVAFAPRNPAELARIARPGAHLVVVTPEPGHLAQLRAPLGMLDVDAGKPASVTAALAPAFEPIATATRTATVEVDRTTAVDLAQMGPAGFHASRDELEQRAAALPDSVAVDLAITLTTFTRRP